MVLDKLDARHCRPDHPGAATAAIVAVRGAMSGTSQGGLVPRRSPRPLPLTRGLPGSGLVPLSLHRPRGPEHAYLAAAKSICAARHF